MKTLRETILVSLLVLSLLVVPVVVYARDRDDDRDDRQHSLLQGSRAQVIALQADIAALKNQVALLSSQIAALQAVNVTSLQSQVTGLAGQVATLTSQVATLTNGGGGSIPANLTALSKYLTIDPNQINGVNGPHVIFSGVNVHIRSGSGATGDGGTLTGLGNLIVGYNEAPQGLPSDPSMGQCPPLVGPRGGSHNIIGGVGNMFTSSGALVLGFQNTIGGLYATVHGGESNVACGFASSILGGRMNGTLLGDQTVP